MQKDELREILKQIEDWCAKYSTAIFYGEIEADDYITVAWDAERCWEKYLETIKYSSTKILIVNLIDSRFVLDNSEESLTKYHDTLEAEDRKEFKEALKVLKSTEGHAIFLTFIFLKIMSAIS